ncbi:MAG: UDP-3-O-(3-hydroxymyristoyl)glucosamine N-acyltransferase [Proteobacteria bacterium]|nr:UDP-3-O-(3-hydroxymyristoyl)glucosamine N-acyltransferase [Pseudomonadota bacterium]
MNASLLEIASLVQGRIIGNEKLQVSGISPIDEISPGSLVFAEGKENLELAEKSDASAILVGKGIESPSKTVIQVSHPFKAFIHILNHFFTSSKAKIGIHPTAVIEEGVKLGHNLSIGAYVCIGKDTIIGDNTIIKSHVSIGEKVLIGQNCVLHPHVTIYDNCELGNDVAIHASSVIGSDGFGYNFIDGKHLKVPHVGKVIIGNEVEIGANTVVDRATLGATEIGEGTKIDNLVQIAHSVHLGKHNILCAFTGIAGSTTSGNGVIFAANVGVSDHVKIDSGVILGARAGVPPKKHLKEGNVYIGSPARPKDKAIELELSATRIPIMRKNLKNLSERVDSLNQRLTELEGQ